MYESVFDRFPILQWQKATFFDKSVKAERAFAKVFIGVELIVAASIPLLLHKASQWEFKCLMAVIVLGHFLVAVHLPLLLEEWRLLRYKVSPLHSPESGAYEQQDYLPTSVTAPQ